MTSLYGESFIKARITLEMTNILTESLAQEEDDILRVFKTLKIQELIGVALKVGTSLQVQYFLEWFFHNDFTESMVHRKPIEKINIILILRSRVLRGFLFHKNCPANGIATSAIGVAVLRIIV